MEFKDYKEKQKYFKEKANQQRMFWTSAMPLNTRNNVKKVKKDMVIKGATYIKQKESE